MQTIYFVVKREFDDSDREVLSIHITLKEAMKQCKETVKLHPEAYVYSVDVGDYI